MVKNRNIAILFFTMVVMLMGFGMVIPIMPFYIESLGASGTTLGALMAIFSIMQFLFSPIWGSLSDRYGRKKLLLLGTFGNGLSMLLFGLSTQVWMLFASRALAGILSAATMPTAMAYISDSSDKKNRGGGMGIIGAAMGVGMVIGPGLGGWLGEVNLSLPFFVAFGLSIASLVLILILLPESLPADKRTATVQSSGPQLKTLWQALTGPLGFLMALSFLVFFALANFEGIFGLYTQYRFDFSPKQVGTVMMVIGVVSAVMQGLMTGPATRRFGEDKLIRWSLLGSAVGFGVMLLARSMGTIMLTTGLFVLANAMLRPAIASNISYKAGDQQGAVLGVSNSFMSLGRVVGPLWAGALIDLNVILPYLSGAVIMLLIYLASLVWLKPAERSPQPLEPAVARD
ncbi:MAG: MFS transporter [Bellilinea sp.]